jgi:hypothetical protein
MAALKAVRAGPYGSAFIWIEMVIAVRAEIAIENFGLVHALTDHLLRDLGIVGLLLLLTLAYHADWVVGVGG